MDNFALLGVCFALGILLRRLRLTPENAAETINAVVIYVSLPAVALSYVHSLNVTPELLAPALMGWIVFFVGWGLFSLLGRNAGWSRKTVVCLTLTAALGNTSFVGLPMIEAFYGPEWTGVGLIVDQGGNFMTLCVVGIALAAATSGRSLPKREILRRLITFPPLLAVLLALALRPVEYPFWVESALQRIGATLSPLALLSVGLTVRFRAIRGRGGPLAAGLVYKMLLAPLVILGLYVGLFGLTGTLIDVTVFEAAMPPMVMGGIVCMQYDLEPELAGLLLGVGIPLSFATVAGWYWLLQWV